jgi:nucleotide-binding universal stress UspA family protein
MTVAPPPTELIALVADTNIEFALRGLLSRPPALGIRRVDFRVFVHPEHDPGCLRKAAPFLRPQAARFRRALVVFDRDGCGKEHQPRTELEAEVERGLAGAGWDDRAAVVVIDPELENWVWSDSPEVDRVLGWAELRMPVRDWTRSQGFTWSQGKPARPKEALQAALRHARKPRSSALFEALAQRVGLERCHDPAFGKLRACLQRWFPAGEARPAP